MGYIQKGGWWVGYNQKGVWVVCVCVCGGNIQRGYIQRVCEVQVCVVIREQSYVMSGGLDISLGDER